MKRAKKQRLYRAVSTANRRRLITKRSRSFEVGLGDWNESRKYRRNSEGRKGKKHPKKGENEEKVRERKREEKWKQPRRSSKTKKSDGVSSGVCSLCSIKRHDETHRRGGGRRKIECRLSVVVTNGPECLFRYRGKRHVTRWCRVTCIRNFSSLAQGKSRLCCPDNVFLFFPSIE